MKITQIENKHIKEKNHKESFQEKFMHQRRHLIIR
jgi:hypothetical protein